jgi:hypothetical protein
MATVVSNRSWPLAVGMGADRLHRSGILSAIPSGEIPRTAIELPDQPDVIELIADLTRIRSALSAESRYALTSLP